MKKETVLLSVVAVVLVFFAGAFFSTSLVTGKEVYGTESLYGERNPDLYSCRRIEVTTTGDAACAGLGEYKCVEDTETNMPAGRTIVNDGVSFQHDELRRGCSYNWVDMSLCPGDAVGIKTALPNTGDQCLNGQPKALCCR